MKHLIPDDSKHFGENVTVLSCETDNGKRVHPNTVYTVGEGMIVLIPCRMCADSIQSQLLEGIIHNAAKYYIRTYKGSFGRSIVYRGLQLTSNPDYEMPSVDSDEYREILRMVDAYLDEGKPMNLYGLSVIDIHDGFTEIVEIEK